MGQPKFKVNDVIELARGSTCFTLAVVTSVTQDLEKGKHRIYEVEIIHQTNKQINDPSVFTSNSWHHTHFKKKPGYSPKTIRLLYGKFKEEDK